MQAFIPKGNQRSRNNKKNYQPFTAELKQVIHKKHRLWKRWIVSRDVAVYDEYKKIRNKVRKTTVKLAQEEQYKISIECKRNPKKFWHYINRKTISNIINIGDLHWTDPNGKAISAERDSDKAAALHDFFPQFTPLSHMGNLMLYLALVTAFQLVWVILI